MENIGKNESTAQDQRPVRQGSLFGLSWKQIPPDVDSIINPGPSDIPYEIDPTFLPPTGHQDADVTKQMSYFWGIIWYFYSLQQVMPAGQRAAWRLGNCKADLLIDGAVRYNGGGNPNYRDEIKAALKRICCSKEFNL